MVDRAVPRVVPEDGTPGTREVREAPRAMHEARFGASGPDLGLLTVSSARESASARET